MTFLEEYQDLKWVLAVSGGPDSMALVNMMKAKGIERIDGHVNYQMRS